MAQNYSKVLYNKNDENKIQLTLFYKGFQLNTAKFRKKLKTPISSIIEKVIEIYIYINKLGCNEK